MLNEKGIRKLSNFQLIRRWQSETGNALWWVQVKHYRYIAVGRLAPSGDWSCFTVLSNMHRCCASAFALAGLFLFGKCSQHFYCSECLLNIGRCCMENKPFVHRFNFTFVLTTLKVWCMICANVLQIFITIYETLAVLLQCFLLWQWYCGEIFKDYHHLWYIQFYWINGLALVC